MTVTTLHLVRHGQTTWNAAGRIQGQKDSPLSELGRTQAEAVAAALAKRPLAALYASDLTRTRDTVAPLAARLGLAPTFDPRLRERSYGELEDHTWAEVEARFPEAYRALRTGGQDIRLPGGESRQDLLDRAGGALDEIAAAHPGAEIAAITHGGVAAVFLARTLGLALGQRPAFRTLNAAVSTFEHDPAHGWRLITWGAIHHLEGLVSPRPAAGTASTA